jgi:hypothetical protein
MAGKIIANTIEAPFDSIRMNVANVTVLTANNSGLTYLPTGNVNVNIGSTASLTLGNVTVSNLITANGNIKFPATQVPSADANTLDDYEEGTFTPTLAGGFSSAPTSYSNQSGSYTVIGDLVFVTIDLDPNGATADATALIIGGLPFTVKTGAPEGAATIGYQSSFNTNAGDTLVTNANSTLIRFYTNAGGNRNGNAANVNINNRIVLSAVYKRA